MLIVMRFFHGLAAAAASVVINALMRDIYPKDEFSRMMSFVMLVTTIAPLVAPMVGGAVLVWFSWHAIFWILALVALLASLMIGLFIRETLLRLKGVSRSICAPRWVTLPLCSATSGY